LGSFPLPGRVAQEVLRDDSDQTKVHVSAATLKTWPDPVAVSITSSSDYPDWNWKNSMGFSFFVAPLGSKLFRYHMKFLPRMRLRVFDKCRRLNQLRG